MRFVFRKIRQNFKGKETCVQVPMIVNMKQMAPTESSK